MTSATQEPRSEVAFQRAKEIGLPTVAPAAPSTPAEFRQRVIALATTEAKGEEIDTAELRDALSELDWSKKKFNGIVLFIKGRIECEKFLKNVEPLAVRDLQQLEVERQEIVATCGAAVAKRRKELEDELLELQLHGTDPIRKFDAENGELINECNAFIKKGGSIRAAMARSADRQIHRKIGELNSRLAAIGNELSVCAETFLNEPVKDRYQIEHSADGTPEKLLGRTVICYEWWVSRRDSAKATLEDLEARESRNEITGQQSKQLTKAREIYHQAANRVDAIDNARRREQELIAESEQISVEIKRVQQLFYQWQFFEPNC